MQLIHALREQKSHWVPNQGCMAIKTMNCLVEEWSNALVCFLYSTQYFRQTNVHIPFRIELLDLTSHENPYSPLERIRIEPWFITCYLILVFWSFATVFFDCLLKSTLASFWASIKSCRIQWNKPFLQLEDHVYYMYVSGAYA